MFRFDHDASQKGVGGCRTCFGRLNHRFESTPHERVAAPAIYWPRISGVRAQASAWNVRAR
jgi:hypothetical protein